MQNTSSTGGNTEEVPNFLELTDLKLYQLGDTGHNARQCAFAEFVAFAKTLVHIADEDDLRTVFNRRDFLNWCLEQGILRMEEKRLVSVKPLQEPANMIENSGENSEGA